MKKHLVLTCSLALLFSGQLSADGHKEALKADKLAANIYMLSGKGGNIGVMTGEDGTFLIDDQFAPVTPAIQAMLKEIGGDSPRFLINTHFHGDHTGGNENFGKSGTLIMAHDHVRKRMAEGYSIDTFKMTSPPANKDALPVVTFNHQLGLHINGESLRAIHVANAHTDGDSIIHFPNANIIHTGDIFFNGFFPFIDVPHGGSLKGTVSAVDEILLLADDNTKIMPGHGAVATKADLKRYRDMLQQAYERLSKLKGKGLSLQQTQAEKPLADLDSKWGKAIFSSQKWIAVVYQGLD